MKRKIIFSGLSIAVAIVATVLVVLQRPGRESVVAEAMPDKQEAGDEGQKSAIDIHQSALLRPEEFQTQTVVKRDAPVPLTVPTERPKQLSEVEKPVREKIQKVPVAASDLYFHKDYESMRKEEIRNPDSKENRAGVVALLQARQRRAGRD